MPLTTSTMLMAAGVAVAWRLVKSTITAVCGLVGLSLCLLLSWMLLKDMTEFGLSFAAPGGFKFETWGRNDRKLVSRKRSKHLMR